MTPTATRTPTTRAALAVVLRSLTLGLAGIASAALASGEPQPRLTCPTSALGDSARLAKSGSSADLSWTDPVKPDFYTVYRGSIVPGRPWTYDHACLVNATTVDAVDDVVPRPGTAFYYYISRTASSCESDLGYDSGSKAVPNVNACPAADSDGDGIIDVLDDCPTTSDPAQLDKDGDARGDLCDNCPSVDNPSQGDFDRDGVGDACDSCTDSDGDGFGDPGFSANTCATDNCFKQANPDQFDTDGDGVGDVCDNCPRDPNPDQSDFDRDGIGDRCDADIDGDGIPDASIELQPQPGVSLLGENCGGIHTSTYVTGFNDDGTIAGEVYAWTRCGGSGRGGGYHSTTYYSWHSLVWDRSGAALATLPYDGIVADPAFTETDAAGYMIYTSTKMTSYGIAYVGILQIP